jgi:hypothetical protein
MTMKSNVGGLDRILRVAAGAAILALGYVNESWLGLVGVVPILTALIGWCPAYLPLGISTCRARPEGK